ncbi:MAG TPA: dihydrolipoyl dehydrogenase, partial [Verrucomicrobiae bacterium]|nr:dihydrolipoyl dehydrogenase [Verrucomicrobiae bacterium]
SKALLDSSELFHLAKERFAGHGIRIVPPELDLAQMMARKENVVKKLTDGIAFLFRKNGIDWIRGTAKLGPRQGELHTVEVSGEEPRTVAAPKVILATGSAAAELPFLPFDGKTVVSAREALSFDSVPEHLVIVGGGYIGLEMGSVWRRLGSKVTVVEVLPKILPQSDGQVAEGLFRALKKQGFTFRMETKVAKAEVAGGKAVLTLESGGRQEEVSCDRVLVSAGRRPLTRGLGLEEAGVELDPKGWLKVDEDYRTSVHGIYAIGDLIPGPMLAHKASEEGTVCVERMAGEKSVVEYQYIPGIVYTWPEGASVGKTEEQLKEEGVEYDVGRFNFAGNGRARCMDETEGFVKVLAQKGSGRLLGIHILGPRASDMIAEAVAVMAFEGSAQDISLICHAHPTLSEAVREAALDVEKRAIHA